MAIMCLACGFFMSWARMLNADSISSRIMYQTWSYPQEKIYLLTDRDSYMSAANKGGALVMTTKDGSEIKDADHNLFIREFKPLGFSNAAEAYEPHYIYDATQDSPEYRAVWIPVAGNPESLSGRKDLNTVIEGITNKGIPLTVRLNSDK